MRRLTRALAPLLVTLTLGSVPLCGQLSPGELSRPHAELEGSANCLKCHEARKGVAADLCLGCHEALSERVAAGLGLHAQDGYERCESCHIEHHGAEFELVWWGDEGEASLDHELTGYALEGAHASLDCRECHKPELISAPEALKAAGKSLDRTFLGLRRDTCLSCHADEHAGQFQPGACLDCHLDTGWKPAARFDHAQSRFPLTGRHREVDCGRCHESSTETGDTEKGVVGYLGLPFSRCTDCHADPHRGRLGPSCESCHVTEGWDRTDRQGFDHGKTRFALVGAHARVPCQDCHPAGRTMDGLRFDRCVDCHEDVHVGQLTAPPPGRSCEGCHTEERFVPSTVTLAAHQETDFPLEGGHLATPCDACHVRVSASEIPGVALGAGRRLEGSTAIRFRFETTSCRDCHADPHAGSTDEVSGDRGCSTCHSVVGWRVLSFDHAVTEFALEGAHVPVACGRCHPSTVADASGPPSSGSLSFAGASTICAGCHEDVHRGQFAEADLPVECGRCHTVAAWRPTLFDHDRDARFALEGAHARVTCEACHEPEQAGEGPDGTGLFIRYKPLPTECSDCHGGDE